LALAAAGGTGKEQFVLLSSSLPLNKHKSFTDIINCSFSAIKAFMESARAVATLAVVAEEA
jgi:hypothetical protein